MSYFDYYGDMEGEVELFSVTDGAAEDMVYRSMAVESNRPAAVNFMSHYEAPVYNVQAFNKIDLGAGMKSSSASSISGSPSSVPFGMSKMNFVMCMADRRMVIESISDHLKTQSNYDFCYFENDFMVRRASYQAFLRL